MESPTTPLLWYQLPHAPSPGTVVASLDTLPDEQASLHELPCGSDPSGTFRLLVLRSGTQVHAFANRCPHFGVPLAARQAQLIQNPAVSISCNVHYARFRWSDGLCVSGDCKGESLIPVALAVSGDGQIRIGEVGAMTNLP